MSVRETPKGSDENLTASSDSFWEVGNYRRTVKRIDDGAKLCDEFMKLIAERAEIEAKYSSKLKNWAKKWEEAIKLGPEYNTMEAAMKGAVNEANSRSNVHTKCRDDLMNDVHELVKKWKTDNYHKSLFQWKETKEAEEGFSKAQKPWAKFLMKVMRAKKAYHAAAKVKEQADKAVTDANKDTNFPPDKLRKLEDLAEKKREEMEKAKQKYERRIDEITHDHNDTYAEGMARQFERCQEFEEKRLEFMKQALMKYHQSLDISEIRPFKDLFIQMSTTFQLANSQQDLDWWSRNHGTAMPHNWPAFEDQNEYKSEKSQRKSIASQVLNVLIANRPKDFATELVSTYTGLKSDSSGSLVSSPSHSCVNRLDNVGSYHVDESSDDLLDIVDVSRSGISEFKTFGRRTSSTPVSHSHKERPGSLDSDYEEESTDPLIDIVDLSYSSMPEFKTFGCKTSESVENLKKEYDPNQIPQKPEKLQYVANSNQVPMTGYKELNHDGRPPSPPPSYTGGYMEENNAYSTATEVQYNTPKPLYNSDPQYDQPNPFGHGDNLDVEPPEDEWDSEPPPLPMDLGVPVRALYEYKQVEDDELSFKIGDILTKLSEVDDQGWCLGRFEGREGLIPADYVEPV